MPEEDVRISTNELELTYDQWVAEVDKIVQKHFGISVHDGVDWDSYCAWDEGGSIRDGVDDWIDSQDIPQDLIDDIVF